MNQQTTFPSLGCLTKRKRADRFWEAMNRVVPWSELAAVVAPHCQAAGTGRLLKMRQLAERIFAPINAGLTAKGLLVRPGAVVDATILAAPHGTKNAEGKRDPEMRPTQKRSDWRFGIKAHIGVDATSGLVHT